MRRLPCVAAALLCLSSVAVAQETQPSSKAALARQKVEDFFTMQDVKFECRDFQYRDKTLFISGVALRSDKGAARVAARHGEEVPVELTIDAVKIVLAEDPVQDVALQPESIEVERPMTSVPYPIAHAGFE